MELLQGKTAIAPGVTRGIGLAVVRVFLQNGARVALFGSRQETADRAVAALKSEGPGWDVIGLAPDLTDFTSVQAAVEAVRARFGGVDILVNNAGISAREPLADYTPEAFRKIMDLNVTAVFNGCKAVEPIMRAAGHGADAAWKEEGRMILLQLFWSFLQIGLFSFGGGYAAMPLIQAQIVTQHGWLGMAEFTDLVTISQMTPGPIAINAATFVGLRVAGVSGALAATVGCMLPSCVLVALLARLYLRYRKLSLLQGVLTSLRPAVVAMIASAGVSILVTAFWDEAVTFAGTNWRLVVIFASSLLLLRRTKLSPILVMTLAGAANLLLELLPFPS